MAEQKHASLDVSAILAKRYRSSPGDMTRLMQFMDDPKGMSERSSRDLGVGVREIMTSESKMGTPLATDRGESPHTGAPLDAIPEDGDHSDAGSDGTRGTPAPGSPAPAPPGPESRPEEEDGEEEEEEDRGRPVDRRGG